MKHNCFRFFRITCFLAFLIVFSGYSNTLFANDKSLKLEDLKYWMNFGLGKGSAGSYADGIEITIQAKKNTFSLRNVSQTEYKNTGLNLSLPEESVSEIGALYGLISKNEQFIISASAGISLVAGTQRGKFIFDGVRGPVFEERSFITFGIPLEVQLSWTPFSFIGCGVQGYANLNSEKSFAGWLFTLQFGKLK